MALPSHCCVSFFTTSTQAWVLVPKKIIGSRGDVETERSSDVIASGLIHTVDTECTVCSNISICSLYSSCSVELPKTLDSLPIAAYSCHKLAQATATASWRYLPPAAYAPCSAAAHHVRRQLTACWLPICQLAGSVSLYINSCSLTYSNTYKLPYLLVALLFCTSLLF